MAKEDKNKNTVDSSKVEPTSGLTTNTNTQIAEEKAPVLSKEELEAKEQAKIQEDIDRIHAEIAPQYNWGFLINKGNVAAHVKYDGTTVTIPSKGSELMRKELIESISKGSITVFKPNK